MKKETISKIEEEINQKITLPNDIKEKVKKHVFTNIIIAISMIIYFTFLIIGSKETLKIVQSVHFNIFSILLLGITICLFEIAYKKENVSLAIYGIETLVVSILTLFFPYIIFELDEFQKKYYMIISVYIALYYIIKSIGIVSKAKKIHIKQSSDIKEIVKKEKRKDVIRVKENNVGVSLQGDPKPKKRGRPKKSDIENKEKIEPKKEQTKKSEKTNNENKQNVGVAPQGDPEPKKRGRPKKNVGKMPLGDPQTHNEQKPKKRGRPRKVVTADD